MQWIKFKHFWKMLKINCIKNASFQILAYFSNLENENV